MLLKQSEIELGIETEGKHAGRLLVGMPVTYNDRLMELPGCKFNSKTTRWTMPKTYNTLLTLQSLAKELGWPMTPTPEVKAWAGQQFKAWAALRGAAAIVRKDGEREGDLYLHQVDGANWMLAAPETDVGRILLDEQGTGKTVTTITALQKAQAKGPILVVALESALDQAWQKDIGHWSPHYRAIQITGTLPQRQKKLQQVKDGNYDVAIIGHSNLKAHTRYESFGNSGLKRCVECGGPRLTKGLKDAKGKPLPDIDYHRQVKLKAGTGDLKGRYFAYCEHEGCTWVSMAHDYRSVAAWEAGAHSRTGKKISELTPQQCQRHTKELNEIPFTHVVIDEIHRATNATAQFTQAMWGVTNYSADGAVIPPQNRWGLTGTPMDGVGDQLWAPLHWIGPENWPTKSEWVDYFCEVGFNWSGFREVKGIKPKRLQEFQQTYTAVTRRVLADQVLDLPPILRWGSLERRLEMGTKQKAQYKQMKDQMMLLVEQGLITADNAAGQAGRLTMLATGCGMPDPGNVPGGPQKMLLEAPSCKLDAILDDFRSGMFADGKVGMMFASAQGLRLIRDGLIKAGLVKPDQIVTIAGQMLKQDVDFGIKAFQADNDRKKIVMLTYAKGGASITLTAAKYVLAVERSWKPSENGQGVTRFRRIGSEVHDHITVLDYVVAGTNEVAQLSRLEDKGERIEQVVRDRKRLAEWFS